MRSAFERDTQLEAAKNFRLTGSALAVLAILSGCTILDPHVPAPELEIPTKFDEQKGNKLRPTASPYDFAVFKSKQLTELIALGRGFNFDIAAAIARIQQAEAQVRIATMPLIPTIQASGSGAQNFSHVQGQPVKTTPVIGQLTASYTLDFWGQNLSALYSAKASEWFASFSAATVAISTDASIANTYFQAIGTQAQLDKSRENLKAANRILKAIQDQQRFGTNTGVGVAQQETLVHNIEVTIPPLESAHEQYKHALAVLVGMAPEFFSFRGDKLNSIAVPVIPAGLPSELLCRRPDIATAEAQLSAAKFTVSSARAAMFPSIQLTGAAGYQSMALASLFQPQNAFYNMMLGITQPITNEYLLQAILDQDKARYGELLADYRRAVVAAFQNVEDALVIYRKARQQELFQHAAVKSAREAFRLTEFQLQQGTIDVTTLVQVQQTLFNAELADIQIRQTLLMDAVSLYQALGGGWYKPTGTGIAEVASVLEVKAKVP